MRKVVRVTRTHLSRSSLMPALKHSPRASRQRIVAADHVDLDDFEEPSVAPDSMLNLKTTGQSLSDIPDEDALPMIEDPIRTKRLQNQGNNTKVQRRAHRAGHADKDQSETAADKNGEKLFIKLRRRLAEPVRATYSDIRETPDQGQEDYRHDRPLTDDKTPGRRRPRRAASAAFSEPPPRSRRGRRSRNAPDADNEESKTASNKRVKKEPPHQSTASLPSSPASQTSPNESEAVKVEDGESNKVGIVNNDFCNSCGGTGELLCCETCVRSFHFSCIDPPVMDVEEIEEEEWSCRVCKPLILSDFHREEIKDNFFEQLILSNTNRNAMAFQLPLNLREMFARVEFTKHGEYLDEEAKIPHTPPTHRIQDKDGNVLLCFKCKGNGLNDRSLAVCSKCSQPWHIDCLDPPLESTPFGYWVCPLHADKHNKVLRVKSPQVVPVRLPRNAKNNGDIEIEDLDDDNQEFKDEFGFDRVIVADKNFENEEITENVSFPEQTKISSEGSVIAKTAKRRPKGFEADRVVHKIPARTIKLDFLDAVERSREARYKENPTSDFMLGLNLLANRPQPDCEAVRNLMLLGISGPTVSTARAKDNLTTLVEAALDDDNEIGQIAAIRKLMKEKGKERLLKLLQDA